jgi:cell division septation protein DedD
MKKLITIILALMLIVACEKSKKIETLPVKDTTSVVIDTVVSDTISEEETTDELKYFVVVGAFKAEWRADKWVETINNEGYTAEKVLSHNDFYIVYVKAGNNKKKALIIMENVRKCVTPRCWVYVKR